MNSRSKKQAKALDEPHWECSVCTYRNAPEAFKCSMCDVRKGTSTRKPKVNVQLATPQYSASTTKSTRKDDDHKDKSDTNSKKKKRFKRSWKPYRLKNIDRNSAQAREITINSLTIRITEYKIKDKRNNADHNEHSSASELSNQSESGFDSSVASHSSRASHSSL